MTAALASLASSDPIAQGRAALDAGDPVTAANLFHAVAEARPADYESR